MRIPRVQFSVRMILVAVAVVGIGSAMGIRVKRHSEARLKRLASHARLGAERKLGDLSAYTVTYRWKGDVAQVDYRPKDVTRKTKGGRYEVVQPGPGRGGRTWDQSSYTPHNCRNACFMSDARRLGSSREDIWQRMPFMNTEGGPKLLDAGIFVTGIVLGIGVAYLTAIPDRPYPRDLWVVDRIGEAATYGCSIAFLGVLASQWGFRGRREGLWMGEWFGITTSALILSEVLVESCGPSALGGVWFLARCYLQCLLWMGAGGILFTKLFTRVRPGTRPPSPYTDISGFLVCAMAGPFVAWQFLHGMTYL